MCLDSDNAMGNMGMLDQVMGLRWVEKYIHHFGGDKDQVTIFGESAGSASITHLLLSNLTDVRPVIIPPSLVKSFTISYVS